MLWDHVVLEGEAFVAVVEDDACVDLGELVGLEVEEEEFLWGPGVSVLGGVESEDEFLSLVSSEGEMVWCGG